MQFKMVCPKCESITYNIERDRRLYSQGAPSSDFIFSCRCGKRLFGEQVEVEHERQRKLWESSTDERKKRNKGRIEREREEQDRKDALKRAYEYRAKFLADKRREAQEEARLRQEDEYRRWQDRVAAADSGAEVPLAPGDETCEWDPCQNVRRSNSKYCSRACSNKNARSRHKKRKTTDNVAAA